jgi:hypothetical protein
VETLCKGVGASLVGIGLSDDVDEICWMVPYDNVSLSSPEFAWGGVERPRDLLITSTSGFWPAIRLLARCWGIYTLSTSDLDDPLQEYGQFQVKGGL